MADYKESTVSGKTWQRANKVEINNVLGQAPSICFHEEAVTQTSAGIIKQPIATCSLVFDQNDAQHLALYNAINDLYIVARNKRDNK